MALGTLLIIAICALVGVLHHYGWQLPGDRHDNTPDMRYRPLGIAALVLMWVLAIAVGIRQYLRSHRPATPVETKA